MKAIAAALCLAGALPVLAQPPDEMDAPTTRAGFKARNERHVSHEAMFASYATGNRLEAGLATATSLNIPLSPYGSDQAAARALLCKADAVAVISVYNQRPVLAKDESFIFTEYKVEVGESIKGRLAVGERTTLARIGGAIELPGDHITFVVPQEWPLAVGHKYLAFLRYLPATNDYTSYNVGTTYEIEPGGKLLKLVHGNKPTPDTLMSALRDDACAGSH